MSEGFEYLPHFAEGPVVSGFGRGSKELGIPTANFPENVIHQLPSTFACGVYYGWATLSKYSAVYKMVMCVGWNPYYHNTVKTMETHILHKFDEDFYGEHLKIIVLGYIRPMCDFSSLDAMIEAIHNDIATADERLESAECAKFRHHAYLSCPAPASAPALSATSSASSSSTSPSTHLPQHTFHLQNGDSHEGDSPDKSVPAKQNSETNGDLHLQESNEDSGKMCVQESRSLSKIHCSGKNLGHILEDRVGLDTCLKRPKALERSAEDFGNSICKL